MVHELTQYDFMLPAVDDWIAGDDRTLAFTVVDSDGTGVDISGATVAWALYPRQYQTDSADAVASGADAAVELVTDTRVDSANGEWEVRVGGTATADLWGEYWHRPEVEQADGTVATWLGEVTLTA